MYTVYLSKFRRSSAKINVRVEDFDLNGLKIVRTYSFQSFFHILRLMIDYVKSIEINISCMVQGAGCFVC